MSNENSSPTIRALARLLKCAVCRVGPVNVAEPALLAALAATHVRLYLVSN